MATFYETIKYTIFVVSSKMNFYLDRVYYYLESWYYYFFCQDKEIELSPLDPRYTILDDDINSLNRIIHFYKAGRVQKQEKNS